MNHLDKAVCFFRQNPDNRDNRAMLETMQAILLEEFNLLREEWREKLLVFTYAGDTSAVIKASDLEQIFEKYNRKYGALIWDTVNQ